MEDDSGGLDESKSTHTYLGTCYRCLRNAAIDSELRGYRWAGYCRWLKREMGWEEHMLMLDGRLED